MTTTEQRTATFDSLDPATGAVVATLPVHGPAEVAAAVGRARAASGWWQELGYAGRAARLRRWRTVMNSRRGELLDLVHRENGKPTDDAYIELWLTLEHLGWAARHAERVLGPHRVRGPLALGNHRGTVEYHPYGVVGVIGPWNYPLFTPMGSIGYALAAGNTVVFKPSEHTPAVGRWIADTMAEACPEQPVLGLVTGYGETGAALVRAGVDKVAFTGSPPTGRKIMAAAAETLTPVLMELGGKDAVIVDDDADVEEAARAVLWGACSNAGQTCAGVERVYVTEPVWDRFVAAVTAAAADLRAGSAPDAPLGPLTTAEQVRIVAEQLNEALDRGARALVGGRDSVRPPYVDPVVLVDVPEDSALATAETFGPLLPLTRVRDADEAVRRANASAYGLGSAVFGRRRAGELARRLRAGMTSVNAVLTYPGFAALPFGGVGESGFGRIHGADGLREFAWAKTIAERRWRAPADLLTFDRPRWMIPALQRLDDLRYRR